MRAVLKTLLVIVLVLIFGFLFLSNHYLGMINKEKLDDVVSPEEETFETEEYIGEDGLDPNEVQLENVDDLNDKKLINILLVGQDRRPGESRQRSDSMILCSINTKTKQVSLISFMRDLYVQIPGNYSDNRLNAPYVFGGFPLLKDTLNCNFGVTVDGCFEVDFQGFEKVIDTVGGIDMELTPEEASIVGNGAVGGMNHLSGSQALEYSRIRVIGTDFGRTERQRKVLVSVFDKVRGCGLSEINDMANAILPCMTTDMSNAQIMKLIAKTAPILGSAEINTYCVPSEGEYHGEMIRGMAVLVPDLQLIREHMESYMPL